MKKNKLDIAVIGMAGRFPGAGSIHKFWENLKDGVESITFFSESELGAAGVPPDEINSPSFVGAKGVLDGIEYFDSVFFNYTPGEANVMEPQVRVFHECVWHALEDAGYDPGGYGGVIGIYAGYHPNIQWNILGMVSPVKGVGDMERLVYNSPFFTSLANYRFNLKGPAVTLHTACSTSLVAIHLACRGLLTGEADIVLAGGVSIMLPQVAGYHYREGMIHSSDGHNRSFDRDADGTVPGEGAGIVVLKRLVKALKDRDHIYAVIKGSAINNDGNRKVGYTAPSVEAQANVIRSAWRAGGVEPGTVSYIEAHGSATQLGDPIEIKALEQAFNNGSNTNIKKICRIGSVKSNIGHLDTAAGVAGFIKTVLSLYHRGIPASLHFQAAGPGIDFENSPFRVNTSYCEWENSSGPLRAGVSSFGIGGTNAHVVLEEAPPKEPVAMPDSPGRNHFLFLSAKTETALDNMTRGLGECLQSSPQMNIADVAYTLQAGRKSFNRRRVVECRDTGEAVELLLSGTGKNTRDFVVETEDRPVVFMFPGLGDQYVGMGWDLYCSENRFKEEMDRCFDVLRQLNGMDAKEMLYPAQWQNDPVSYSDKEHGNRLFEIGVAQVVVFCFEYALAKWLMNHGIKPHAMIGYSFGEYTAACISGVLSLEDALNIIAARGELLNRGPGGVMVSVPMTAKEVEPLLDENLSLAIDNGDSCVVAGSQNAVRQLEEKLKEMRLMTMTVPASHGLHSHLMEPLVESFTMAVRRFTLNKPQIPYISNVTGQWMTDRNAVDGQYWGRHLRETVQFHRGMTTLLEIPNAVWIEVGPGSALSTLASHMTAKQETGTGHKIDITNLVPFPGQKVSGHDYLLKKMARLWMLGVAVAPGVFHPVGSRERVPLPGYPFDRHHFPVDFSPLKALVSGALALPGQLDEPGGPFYIPSWKAAPLPRYRPDRLHGGCCVVFCDEFGIGGEVARRLRQDKVTVVMVEKGEEFEVIGEHHYCLHPLVPAHYGQLFGQIAAHNILVNGILHPWNVSGPNFPQPQSPGFLWDQDVTDAGVMSLFYLLEAAVGAVVEGELGLHVVTDHMHEVNGHDLLHPLKAAVLGVMRFIPKQFPMVRCSCIDIAPPEPGKFDLRRLGRQLAGEVTLENPLPVTVYRGNNRMARTVEPARLEAPEPGDSLLKENCIYMITNGVGRTGLMLAQLLARIPGARLVLLTEPGFPEEEQWDDWSDQRVDILKQVKKECAGIMTAASDPWDPVQMEELAGAIKDKWGAVTGMFHLAAEPGGPLPPMEQGALFKNDVRAVWVLDHVFRFDFMVLGSLLASAVSGPGGAPVPEEAEIQAVNTCFNAFAMRKNSVGSGERYYLSLNWDFSIAGENNLPELLDKALNSGMSRVMMTNTDLKRSVDMAANARQDTVQPVEPGQDIPGMSDSAYLEPQSQTEYAPPRNRAERMLVESWEEILGVKPVGIHDNFFHLGGDSLKGMNFVNHFQELLGEIIHITIIFDAPTVAQLAEYFQRHYPEGFARMVGDDEVENGTAGEVAEVEYAPGAGTVSGVTGEMIDRFQRRFSSAPALTGLKPQANPPMVFVLSPPRTGSTLLRVMLAGNPRLFAPPELNVLNFSTMRQRMEKLGGAGSSHLQGAVRAVRQIRDCSLEEAEALIDGYQRENLPVQEFYRLLQEWLGDRLLVDKSPGYAMSLPVMKQAEDYFREPYYIHLLRHPYGMINSYMEAKLDLLIGRQFAEGFSLSRRELAEITWTVNVKNILKCLEAVPGDRQLQIKFEDLVKQPETTARSICDFLKIPFDPGMTAPYQDKTERMTDGLHESGIMLGDMKFHHHKKIDPSVADNWKNNITEDFLSPPTQKLAHSLHYHSLQ